jgi:tRNA(His) 5'-end guanylyltransferase
METIEVPTECNVKNINNIIDNEKIFDKRSNLKSIEEGMKLYENHSITPKIPNDRPFIIRLNADSYVKIINVLNHPNITEPPKTFNKIYNIAMIRTAEKLLLDSSFKPVTIYTQYDEIIIIFDASLLFNQNSQKYITILASKASNYFIREFYKLLTPIIRCYTQTDASIIDKNIPVFEARVVYFPKDKEYEIMNYILWRYSKIRSFIQDCTELVVHPDELVKKNKEQQVELYKSATGIDIEDNIPHYMTEGVYLKKSIYNACYIPNHPGSDGKAIDIIYPVSHIWSMKVKYSEDILAQILNKYYVTEKWQSIATNQNTKIWYIYDQDELARETIYFKNPVTIINQNRNTNTNTNTNNNTNNNVTNSQLGSLMSKEILEKIRNDLNKIPIIYNMIPFWSIHLVLMHLICIFNNNTVSNIIQIMTYYALAYSIGIRFISVHINEIKFNIHKYMMLFWIVIFWMISFTSILKLFEKSEFVQLISILAVYYGYYFTIMNGILLFVYIKNKINAFKFIEKIKKD